MAARRFLWLIVILVILVLIGAVAYRLLGARLLRLAMVPSVAFEESPAPDEPDYARPENWLARPGMAGSPAQWTPEGYGTGGAGAGGAAGGATAAIFYVPPTTYLSRGRWNAPLDDPDSRALLDVFARSQASIFGGAGELWAPRYRQATFGAFLSPGPEADAAIDLAYGDVARAFDRFLAEAGPERPIFLAGHSQGSLQLTRLLAEKVAGRPLARRVVAAYLGGWPVAAATATARLGLPPCDRAEQTGCLLAWQSFAEPADPAEIVDAFARSGRTDLAPGGRLVCTNPLTGTGTTAAVPAAANLGSLLPNETLTGARLVPGLVGARCDPRGLLLIGAGPEGFGRFILPGNNFHAYDYALFWANLRADVERRLSAYRRPEPAP